MILERGERLADCAEARDDRAIFARGHFRPRRDLVHARRRGVQSGQLLLCRRQLQVLRRGADPLPRRGLPPDLRHLGGTTPGWPIAYDDLEPWYQAAEELYARAGRCVAGPDRAAALRRLSLSAGAGRAGIAAVRARLQGRRGHAVVAAARHRHRTLAGARGDPWDAFPDTTGAKMDAESVGIAKALAHPNVTLETGALVTRLVAGADGRDHRGRVPTRTARRRRLSAPLVVLAPGRSIRPSCCCARPGFPAAANRSDQVGRNFMNHNCSAVMAVHPLRRNDAVYQKTFLDQRLLPDRRP